MEVLVEGSGGSSGWPQPGCRCASCLRAAADGKGRERSTIVVDGRLRLGVGGEDGEGLAGGGEDGDGGGVVAGFCVRRVPAGRGAGEFGGLGGWDVTSAAGERLLYPAGPGAVPDPPEGTIRYDVAFLDLLGDPAQLGRLRARGLVTAETITAVAFADHRVPAAAELERRCAFWRVDAPGDGDRITTDRSAQGFKGFKGEVRPWRVLMIGGARSGKSERAELRLAAEPDVTYVATAPQWPDGAGDPDRGAGDPDRGAGDPEWVARVAAHQARRPAWWRTAETTDLAGVLGAARGAVLIDGIGTWLAAVLDEGGAWDGRAAERLMAARTAELIAAWRQTRGYVVAVSDEAGLGVVPATAAGRLFRDELGRLNQALAAESEETEMIVAGRAVPLSAW